MPVSITAYTDKTFTYVRMALPPWTLQNHVLLWSCLLTERQVSVHA